MVMISDITIPLQIRLFEFHLYVNICYIFMCMVIGDEWSEQFKCNFENDLVFNLIMFLFGPQLHFELKTY